MVFIYFIGHLQATARDYWLQQNGAGWIAKTFLALVALAFPDLQLFNLVDDIVAGTAIPAGLFAQTAVLGCVYTSVYFFFAWVFFTGGNYDPRRARRAAAARLRRAARADRVIAHRGTSQRLFPRGAARTSDLREQIGQLGFLAALSGFRSLVADVIFIQAHVAWENTEWGRVLLLFREATTLQPRSILFWDMAAWHMAWNASVAALHDPNLSLTRRLRRKAADGIHRARERFPRARDQEQSRSPAALRIARPPRRGQARTITPPPRAFTRRPPTLPGATEYDERFAAYELSYAPGQERAAYDALLALYRRGPSERLPTLLKRLKFLEDKLDIPVVSAHPRHRSRNFLAMRFAILSDIHGNLEALEAVLADAEAQDCTHFVCLGDVVGYNANPSECVKIIQDLECPVVKGNHDEQASIDRLDRRLQRAGRGSDRLDARASFRRGKEVAGRSPPHETSARFHHRPRHPRYARSNGATSSTISTRSPASPTSTPRSVFSGTLIGRPPLCATITCAGSAPSTSSCSPGKNISSTPGSVGQPRDRDWRAAYCIYDSERQVIEQRRVEYDLATTQRKIRAAGLPERLADRLAQGR